MAGQLAQGTAIRFAAGEEAPALAGMTRTAGDPIAVDVLDVLAVARRVFVAEEIATGVPIGLAAVGEIEGLLAVESLCVLREWRRRGLGSALLATAEDFGRWAFFPQILAVPRSAAATAMLFRRGYLTVDATRMPSTIARFGDGRPVVTRRL